MTRIDVTRIYNERAMTPKSMERTPIVSVTVLLSAIMPSVKPIGKGIIKRARHSQLKIR